MIDVEGRKRMFCPYLKEMCINGWTKSMGQNEETGERPTCRMWTHVHGKDPFSEQDVELWDCSLAWMPTINSEIAQRVVQTGIAVQEVRNTIIDSLPEQTQREVLEKSTRRMLVQATQPSTNPDGIDKTKVLEAAKDLIGHQPPGGGNVATPKAS
jgi:hypothetical protein